jgi:hypothetical protein
VDGAAAAGGLVRGGPGPPRKYAGAGIPHYWCIEDEDGTVAVHVHELDRPTGTYAPAGIFRHGLKRPVPFEISLDLDALTP